ncbi:hypothetical protein GEMRC1_010155 [Eukaryota sp. GEM-RC1]
MHNSIYSSFGDTSSNPQPFSSLTHSLPLLRESSFKHVHFQQSLLILIQFHYLNRLIKLPLPLKIYHKPLLDVINGLISFFEKVGFVSQHFFDSAFSAVESNDLVLLYSISSFFKADIHSVALAVFPSLELADIHQFTDCISQVLLLSGFRPYDAEFDGSEYGSDSELDYTGDTNILELFDKSSSFFLPRVTRLNIEIYATSQPKSTFSAFCKVLLANTTVVHLSVKIFIIATPQIQCLSEVFSSNNTLRTVTLSFDGDRLKDAKALLLISALSNSSSIEKIDLSNFPVRNSSVLLPLLKNSRLRSIVFCKGGCITILNDLKYHCSLREVTYHNNRFVAEISEIFQFNRCLKKLEVRKCSVELSTLFKLFKVVLPYWN